MPNRSSKWVVLILSALGGCTAISIAPTCPEELRVGESGTVRANEKDAGAIPTYRWEVFPSDAGVFEDSTATETAFEARKEVDVVIRLTASDGLYQVISQCSTRIRGAVAVAVALEASPNPALVGETVTLTCSSIGEGDAVALAIAQVEGDDVELTDVSDGVAEFTPTQIGDRTFRCVGENADGEQSEPAFVTVVVTSVPDGNENDNDNGTDNENANGNDNDNTNDNGNGGRPPPVGPRG